MSSYVKKLRHPVTGEEKVALCLDDFYGHHLYGYGFKKDGSDADLHGKFNVDDYDFFRSLEEHNE